MSMTKRHVQADELREMKKAVFIWKRSPGEYIVSNVVISKHMWGFFAADPIGLDYEIATAHSVEEAMLKAQVLCPGERFFEVDDTLRKEEFCSPFSFVDLLRPEWHVNEVIP